VLRELAPDLWVAERPLRFLGTPLGTRMTVVRFPGRRLWIHSPVARDPDLALRVEALGTPTFLVAPNRFHHLFVGEWQAAYHLARLYVAPGLETKRKDLAVTAVLGDPAPPAWSGVLDQVVVEGFPLLNEVVFFHLPSRTLVSSDLAFNVGPTSPFLTRIAFRVWGAYGRLSVTYFERLLVRDRAAYRHSIERILAWPIERVIVAHGEIVPRDGRDALARAFAWLLRG
jgi:hypothetical protein